MSVSDPAGRPSPAPGRPSPAPATLVLALALLLGLQPVSTDLYLPALPALAAEFGGAVGLSQLTLSVLLLAFGFGQLLLGPASDRWGRRPVLLGGLGLYVLATLAGTLAQRLEVLVLCRGLQGVGLAAAVVCGRALLRDLHGPREGAALMSKSMSGLGMIALASPAVGGLLASVGGWRAALAATGVFAAVALAVVASRLPETLRQPNPRALVPAEMARTWLRILVHPTFQAWVLLTSFTYGGLYTFLACGPFVYIEVLGTSRAGYGLFLTSSSLAYLCGTFFGRRLLRRHGLRGAVGRAAGWTLSGGLLLAGLSLAGVVGPWAIALPHALFMFGHGVHQPCAQAAVVGPFPAHAGAASALSGFLTAALAFALGLWFGQVLGDTVYPLTLTQGLMAVLTATAAWTLVQRHGEAPQTPSPVTSD
jgi:DHA1 family bicyclomycin/chloramphenicol resistance-like MFS transporter